MTTKRKLIFLGGGDFVRELLWTTEFIPAEDRDWTPFGILDDNVDKAKEHLHKRGVPLPILGTIRDHQPNQDEVFIPAIGNPVHKLRGSELLESRGAQFINLMHPTALVAPDAQIGVGIFAFINSIISVNARIDDFVTFNASALAGHDAIIGRGCTLNPGCKVTGNAKLGRGVVMGSLATIAPGREVGEFSTVGAGSAALTSVPPGVTVLGTPAKQVWPLRSSSAAAGK